MSSVRIDFISIPFQIISMFSE